jgi:hypothetical protein
MTRPSFVTDKNASVESTRLQEIKNKRPMKNDKHKHRKVAAHELGERCPDISLPRVDVQSRVSLPGLQEAAKTL